MYLIDKLIGVGEFLISPYNWYLMLLIALGVTAIIFFHELGHFLVARWCGVKCEKFYVGFGKPLLKVQWGETEYGLGMIPLGGYVKMLGQDDNPNKAGEEMERAKTGEGDTAALDPRSYLAKSVPQRMAIISAGVVMNVIFAFVVATATYFWFGVDYQPCVVSAIRPGAAAWENGVHVGDRIEQIGDKKMKKFRDLRARISLGDIENGIEMTVERPGPDGPQLVRMQVDPDTTGRAPMIGIISPRSVELADLENELPVLPDTAAARATPPLAGRDQIVAVNEQPVESYADLHAILADNVDKTLTFSVERNDKTVPIDIGPNPFKELGLVMKWGKITAVQQNSPAHLSEAEGGSLLQEGDLILSVDGQPVDGQPPVDPLTFPNWCRLRGADTIQITVQREGEQKTVELTLRPASTFEAPFAAGDPISVPSLGIAYEVFNIVESVTENSPAAKAGLKAGDHIEWVQLVPTEAGQEHEEMFSVKKLEFDDEHLNWAYFAHVRLQYAMDDTKVRVKPKGRDPVELEIAVSTTWFNPDRGLILDALRYERKAGSFGEALSLGATETWEQLTMIYHGLRAIIRGQVSAKSLHSPIGIAGLAFRFAEGGWSSYLIFLTLLSANLAVINFLPIPILDGGHMVFLAYEGIRGKPPSERVMVGAMYIGLIFLMSIMLFAVSLDVGIISRD